MINCRQASELISRRRESPLSLGERISLRLHLLMCYMCRRFERQIEFLGRMAARYRERIEAQDAGLDPQVRERILEGVRRKLDESGSGSPGANS